MRALKHAQVPEPHAVVVLGKDTDIHRRVGPLELLERHAGVLERRVRRLQQQALLRVGAVRVARRDAEEARVELGNVLAQEVAVARRQRLLAGRVVGRVVEGRAVPARRGDGPVACAAAGEEVLELGAWLVLCAVWESGP